MLAARDQENLVHGHQQVAAAKPLNQTVRSLQPKTPGTRYPKTPLKVPLHDENSLSGFGGKPGGGNGMENLGTSKMGSTLDKNAFVTPMGPRTRAPLGMKTTNAKAKAFQTPGGLAPEKEFERFQAPKTSVRRPKKVTHADAVKLQIHGDESPLAERDVEYAPPKPKDLPYESDVFPDGCLNYDIIKPENMMRGMHQAYHCEVDEEGRTELDRRYEEEYQRSAKATDEQILKMMEEEWTVGDVPETFQHLKKKMAPNTSGALTKKTPPVVSMGPATITSRRAASALSVPPKLLVAPSKASKPAAKPAIPFIGRSRQAVSLLPSKVSEMGRGAANIASKSTIGYSKGRSAMGALHKREAGLTRSVSNMSEASDTTITPARFAEQENDEFRRFNFLKAFDVDDEEIEPGLRGVMPACLRAEDEDEEFILKLTS